MAPPSSLRTTNVRSGRRWPRPSEQAVRVMEEGEVAEVGDGPGRAGAAERDADGRRDHAVDAGETAVADHEAVLERWPRRAHDVEVADRVGGADHERGVARATARATTAATASGERPTSRPGARDGSPWAAARPASMRADSRASASRHASNQAASSGPSTRGTTSSTRATRPGSVATPSRPRTASTSRPGSLMRLVTGRDRVGWPTTTTRSMSPRRAVVSSSRPVRRACRPMRAPDVGSATSGQPAASASSRAAGPASSPATTRVRGPSGSTSPSVRTDTDGSTFVPGPAPPGKRAVARFPLGSGPSAA